MGRHKTHETSYKGLGALCLAGVILLWVSSSVLQQQLFDSLHYTKPYLLTYFTCVLFTSYLTVFIVKDTTLPIKQLVNAAIQLGPLWFIANVCLSESLVLTSVASNTILSSLSGVFSLVMSVMFLRSSPDILKFVAAISAVIGVGLISMADGKEEGNATLLGDFLAFIGSIFYACYSVVLKSKKIETDFMCLFGLIGLVNSVLFLPGLVLLDQSELETLKVPTLEILHYFVLASLSCSVILDLLLAVSIKHLSPALCTMSLTLTIPLSFLVEAFYMEVTFTAVYLLGTLLVIIGFIIMAMFENDSIAKSISNASLRKLFYAKY
jgi:solute carrier family 35 protein F5